MRHRGLDKHGLIRDFQSRSPGVRSYVTLFEQLCLAVEKEPRPLIAVTSPSRGDGRTTTAANLALCAAVLGGRKALLVDADFDRPMLPRLLAVEGSGGIDQVLQGNAEWQDMVRPVDDGKLSLLPSGENASSALVAAQPDRLAKLVEGLRSTFDWIVVDVPPVLSSSSVLAFGQQATGVLLVARAGRTRAEVVREAATRLDDAGVRILGAVLNRRRFVIPRYAYRRL